MRKLASLFGACCALASTPAFATEPMGTVLELHSCELFAGGCVVSSEATLGGRYMLQAWNFTGGTCAGSELTGLPVAILQASSRNLADDKSTAAQAIVYLPEKASKQQRKALLAWATSHASLAPKATIETRVAKLSFTKTDNSYTFSAGEGLRVTAASPSLCESGGCGEELWYAPRIQTSVFTVAVDKASRVIEPKLKLKWEDSGKRSIFLARFGEASSAPNTFLTAGDLCAPSDRLF